MFQKWMQPAPPSRLFRFPDASRPQTGALPRNRLAFPATGGASPLSPSRGRQLVGMITLPQLQSLDATRTPHGDGNNVRAWIIPAIAKMQPAPLTGTAT